MASGKDRWFPYLDDETRVFRLAIVAFTLSFLGPLSTVGLILGVVSAVVYRRNPGYKGRWYSYLAVLIGGFWLLLGLVVYFGKYLVLMLVYG